MLGLLASGGLAACGGDVARDQGLERAHADLSAAASSGASCDALLAQFKSQLSTQMEALAEQARQGLGYYPYPLYSANAGGAGVAAPRSASDSGEGGFSGTTSSIPGVEPGDFVKAEGDRIYLLHGATLLVLDTSGGASELASSIPLDGDGIELFVHDGKVAVFSYYYGELPDAYSSYTGFTKLAVIDTTGVEPVVLRERIIEGYHSGSARTGGAVHGAVQQYSRVQLSYPPVSYTDIFGRPRPQEQVDAQVDLWLEFTREEIEESSIEDYIARQYEPVAGELEQLPLGCESLLPLGGTMLDTSSTALLAVDLTGSDGALSAATVLGSLSAAASGDGNDVLWRVEYDSQDPSNVSTQLYVAEHGAAGVQIAASGSVSGYLQTTPSLDAGVLRLVTYRDVYEQIDDSFNYVGTESQVVTLRAEQGQLVVLGQTSAEPTTDYVTAASFAGDRGYLLTSGEALQLKVVDLSDPSSPRFAGQVAVPGYGYSLLPLPDERVLVVTPYSDLITYSPRLRLLVVDASDPGAPSIAGEYLYGGEATSEIEYDSRAISFHPDHSRLAFPVHSYTTGTSSVDVFSLSAEGTLARLGGVSESQELSTEECLALFGYPTDPEFIAELDPELLEVLLQQCSSYLAVYMRRGLFRGEELFALSSSAVASYALDALDGPPLHRLELPAPTYSSGPAIGVPVPAPTAPAPAPSEEPSNGGAADTAGSSGE